MKIIEKPEPPASNECCGSGSCCPCVWDYYRQQLALWQQQQAASPSEPAVKAAPERLASYLTTKCYSIAFVPEGPGRAEYST